MLSFFLCACVFLVLPLAGFYLATPEPQWRPLSLLVLLLTILTILVWLMVKRLKRSLWVLTGGVRSGATNPFASVYAPSPAPLVTARSERDAVLKQIFSPNKVPEVLDAIVVGKERCMSANQLDCTLATPTRPAACTLCCKWLMSLN